MNAGAKIVCFILLVDSFLVSFAVGFNSRHVLVIDPSLPASAGKSAQLEKAAAAAGGSSDKGKDVKPAADAAKSVAGEQASADKPVETKEIKSSHGSKGSTKSATHLHKSGKHKPSAHAHSDAQHE